MAPGFLIGGVPMNFGVSARLGDTPFFVIEADEYDTAFCDKRSKFVHYKPRTVVLNNLEFIDHVSLFWRFSRDKGNAGDLRCLCQGQPAPALRQGHAMDCLRLKNSVTP